MPKIGEKRTASQIGKSNVLKSKVLERRVAQLFTAWAGVGFRRRRVTGREDAVRIVELVADIIPVDGDFHFSIEVKSGKGFSLDALLANPHTSLMTKWWLQTCFDASVVSRDQGRTIYPLLFFKPHPNNDWIAFSTKAVAVLRPRDQEQGNGAKIWFPHLRFDGFARLGPVRGVISFSRKNKKEIELELDPVVFCRWNDFTKYVDPKSAFITTGG